MRSTKTCKTCNQTKEIELFVKSNQTKSGYRGICKACSCEYYAKRRVEKYELVRSYERKFHRARRLKYTYNITEKEISDLTEKQNNCCAICKTQTKLVIDHCHANGHVRGLLCGYCNLGLGHFKDQISLLENAKEYLNNNKGIDGRK